MPAVPSDFGSVAALDRNRVDDPKHWRPRAAEARAMVELMSDGVAIETLMAVADGDEQLARQVEEWLPGSKTLLARSPTLRGRCSPGRNRSKLRLVKRTETRRCRVASEKPSAACHGPASSNTLRKRADDSRRTKWASADRKRRSRQPPSRVETKRMQRGCWKRFNKSACTLRWRCNDFRASFPPWLTKIDLYPASASPFQ